MTYVSQGPLVMVELGKTTNALAEKQSTTDDFTSVISHGESASSSVDVEPRYIDARQGTVISARFLPDGNHVVTSGPDGTVRRWDADCAKAETLFRFEEKPTVQVFSKDGKWIARPWDAKGRRVAVWGTFTRERVLESAEEHEQVITALDISSDGSKIASGSRDGTVFVWCSESGQRLAGPFRHGQPILSVRFSPRGDRLAISGSDYLIVIRSIRSCRSESVTCDPTSPASSLTWANDGFRLFAGCRSGSILRFDLSGSTSVITEWPEHRHFESIIALSLSNSGKFIASASISECIVKVWDVDAQKEPCSLEHTSEVHVIEISPDDRCLLSCTKDGKIALWDIQSLPATYFYYPLAASLISRNTPSLLTEFSSGAYVAFRDAEVIRAEQIMTFDIGQDSNRSHYHLANRALVRIHLQQWDDALNDARSSLQVHPTLVAHLARSVAYSGGKQHGAAMKSLVALGNCKEEERDLVSIVKAVVLFNSGTHDAAIRHLDRLMGDSPNIKHLCAFVQAKMYFLMAASALEHQEYTKAIPLITLARDLCPFDHPPKLDTITFVTGWAFESLRLTIHQQLCDAWCEAGDAKKMLDTLRQVGNLFGDEVKLSRKLCGWFTDFRLRCVEMFENSGDLAMKNKDYRTALAEYSEALGVDPVLLQRPSLYLKRCDALVALSEWEGALEDADKAIGLSPSVPWGYEKKHAALHNLERYKDAIATLEAMIAILECSSDPNVQNLRGNYINPSDTVTAILEAFDNLTHDAPFRLIDTTSGQLCDAEERKKIFKNDPIFWEMVSCTTTQLDREHIDVITKHYLRYATLSHRWEGKELVLADVVNKSIYDLDSSQPAMKLKQFCRLAQDSKIRWAWSDTCCINKDKDVEFEKSINSMFRWYRGSTVTIAYLSDVPSVSAPGALGRSLWLTRGWTLQELLAPPIIRFYNQDWALYLNNSAPNHKDVPEMLQELENATHATADDLVSFQPGFENIRVKLGLASTRETTVPVDMAYGLFGIFGVTMSVIHGENLQNALGRLLQEIVAQSGNLACLGWVGKSSEFNSAFPDHVRVYARSFYTVSRGEMEDHVTELRRRWTLEEETKAVAFYEKLFGLSQAGCANQHLRLPCIIFRLSALKKVRQSDRTRVYRATASSLQDTEICTEDRLSSRSQNPKAFVLVCPWIQELLGAASTRHDVETASSVDSSSESEQEDDASLSSSTSSLDGVSTSPGSDSASSSQTGHEEAIVSRAAELVVRFRQPLGAFLLLALGREQYQRVATDCAITIRVREACALDRVVTGTLVVR